MVGVGGGWGRGLGTFKPGTMDATFCTAIAIGGLLLVRLNGDEGGHKMMSNS